VVERIGGGTYLELSNVMDLVDRLGVGVGGRVGSVQRIYVCQQEQPVGFHSRCYLNLSAPLRNIHFKLPNIESVLRLCQATRPPIGTAHCLGIFEKTCEDRNL